MPLSRGCRSTVIGPSLPCELSRRAIDVRLVPWLSPKALCGRSGYYLYSEVSLSEPGDGLIGEEFG
ncbi:hypothetical protein RxyAA322_02850 [Rubrobacter xylanophilus]|uniref:Uncharacterized protein n=1 Tax=Rubrobacter xylanophilus TaxID=49319 RepID=A0A510HEQ9_9ACTN|nr:hypothetical protein RxyAA322_02850 [Rubrobacter xylanophilus]